eukprot:PITA_18009
MDYMSTLPYTKHNNSCIFMVIDRFSKMTIMAAYKKSITAEATAKLFFKQVWVHFGIPQSIVSDRDNRFLSAFCQAERANNFIEHIQHNRQQVDVILDRSNAKHQQCHDQHQVSHKFQVGDKVWLHLQKECLAGPHCKLRMLRYGPYTITKPIGDNAFKLNIPLFLGLHVVFDVDHLQPYFPPLLDTYGIAEQLTPTELNPDYMEHATIDHIMDTQIKNTFHRGYNYIELSK